MGCTKNVQGQQHPATALIQHAFASYIQYSDIMLVGVILTIRLQKWVVSNIERSAIFASEKCVCRKRGFMCSTLAAQYVKNFPIN